jgi:hypothetical protein
MLETAAYLYFGGDVLSLRSRLGPATKGVDSGVYKLHSSQFLGFQKKLHMAWGFSSSIFLQYAKDISLFIRAYFLDFAIRKVFNWL